MIIEDSYSESEGKQLSTFDCGTVFINFSLTFRTRSNESRFCLLKLKLNSLKNEEMEREREAH